MQEVIVENFSMFHDLVSKYMSDYTILYRGQANASWELRPKAGRPPYNQHDDKKTFSFWKHNVTQYFTSKTFDEWEWLSIAQHLGVPTRLLDWSKNPLVAAWFAVAEQKESDAAIFIYNFTKRINLNVVTSPFSDKLKNPSVYSPPLIVHDRIKIQKGYFTVHPNPQKVFDLAGRDQGEWLVKLVIPKKYKNKFALELKYYGYTYLEIFPDVEGLTKFINWRLENKDTLPDSQKNSDS